MWVLKTLLLPDITGSLADWVECSAMTRETRFQSQVDSYQSLKIGTWYWKCNFLVALDYANFFFTYYTQTVGEEARQQLHKNVASNIEQVQAATPHKAPTIRPPASHHENYPS